MTLSLFLGWPMSHLTLVPSRQPGRLHFLFPGWLPGQHQTLGHCAVAWPTPVPQFAAQLVARPTPVPVPHSTARPTPAGGSQYTSWPTPAGRSYSVVWLTPAPVSPSAVQPTLALVSSSAAQPTPAGSSQAQPGRLQFLFLGQLNGWHLTLGLWEAAWPTPAPVPQLLAHLTSNSGSQSAAQLADWRCCFSIQLTGRLSTCFSVWPASRLQFLFLGQLPGWHLTLGRWAAAWLTPAPVPMIKLS